ncbi:MAG: phosphoribosylglycinamide formyltransferase [Rhodospirillaceae bacterium]|nr:phosphoribosylglycinamide formyltransferase [Rhodospirillaceae bacterium]
MNGLPSPLRLGFLASHNGTNMRAVVAACRDRRLKADPVLLISNNRDSAALAWAADNGLAGQHISATSAGSDDNADAAIAGALRAHRVDVVILAGYMRKLGPRTLAAFPRRILNAHPALLPKFGGQGMYGARVHTAVLSAGEIETGVTIHLVDEVYDHGAQLAQAKVPVMPGDAPETLAARVQAREQELFPEVLGRIIAGEIDLDRV